MHNFFVMQLRVLLKCLILVMFATENQSSKTIIFNNYFQTSFLTVSACVSLAAARFSMCALIVCVYSEDEGDEEAGYRVRVRGMKKRGIE